MPVCLCVCQLMCTWVCMSAQSTPDSMHVCLTVILSVFDFAVLSHNVIQRKTDGIIFLDVLHGSTQCKDSLKANDLTWLWYEQLITDAISHHYSSWLPPLHTSCSWLLCSCLFIAGKRGGIEENGVSCIVILITNFSQVYAIKCHRHFSPLPVIWFLYRY